MYTEKKKGITYSEKSKRLTGMNIYVTNTPLEWVPMEQIHDFYSLRWQIEIIFKTWKSLFQIHDWHNIKRERLECHIFFICLGKSMKIDESQCVKGNESKLLGKSLLWSFESFYN